ncbi:restriction endonuclease subunit S [Gordonia sp. NPDC003424]
MTITLNPFESSQTDLVPVGSAYTVTLGKMLDGGKTADDSCATLPYIRAANIHDDGLRLTDINEMPFSESEASRLDLRRGDLLVVEGGAVGTNAVLDRDMRGWSFQKTVNRVRPIGDWSTRYLGYVLRAYRDAGIIGLVCNGSTIPHLTAEKLRALRIPYARPVEQFAIADYLDHETTRIDTLIEEQKYLIEMLRERRRAVVLHVILEPALTGSAHDKLGRTAHIGNGSTPRRDNTTYWDGGDIPWLNSSVVNRSRVTRAEQFVTHVALRECHLPVVAPGSILVGLTGQGKTRGMATILDIEATVNQHVAYVTPDRSRWLADYLLWSITAAYDELRRLSDENGSTKGGLTCEALKQFRVTLPPLDEQRRAAKYLDDQTTKIDTLIAETERFIELSRERRSALITAAVTGQIDVRKT